MVCVGFVCGMCVCVYVCMCGLCGHACVVCMVCVCMYRMCLHACTACLCLCVVWGCGIYVCMCLCMGYMHVCVCVCALPDFSPRRDLPEWVGKAARPMSGLGGRLSWACSVSGSVSLIPAPSCQQFSKLTEA